MPRWLAVVVVLLVLITAGCAPGGGRWTPANRANFWAGLWHGSIWPVTLVCSIFTSQVRVYESNNIGFGYVAGFIIAIGAALLIGFSASDVVWGLAGMAFAGIMSGLEWLWEALRGVFSRD